MDTYLHYKIHSGDLELYNIEAKVIDGEGKTGLGESRFNLALVPANAAILGNESYLAYLLIDSKGMSFY